MTVLKTIHEQRELVDSFTRPLDALFPVSRLHKPALTDRHGWSQMAELGWLGVSLAENVGGIGLGPIEEALAFEAFGRHLLSPCLAASVIAASVSFAAGQPDLARAFASGEQVAAFGISRPENAKITAIDACNSDFLVIMAPDCITVHAPSPLLPTNDTRWALPLLDGKPGGISAQSRDSAIIAFAELVIAATLSGIASQACDMAVGYAKIREQFGQPIGAFQAVKHHCATMAINAYGARELIAYAAAALSEEDAEAPMLASAALSFGLRAARVNCDTNIQVHGGMGFSAECDAHLFLKYTHVLESVCGGMNGVRARLAGQ